MDRPELLDLFVSPLNDLGLTYMVTGAVAAIIYGEPRLTRDLDVVVALGPDDARRLAATFSDSAFYVAPVETIEAERKRDRGGHFNIIHLATALKADLYLAGRDPLHDWAMPRRVRQEVGGTAIWVAPAEYVIVRKLEWLRDSGSSRHADDIRAMLRVSGDRLDQPALQQWIARLDLLRQWREVTTPR